MDSGPQTTRLDDSAGPPCCCAAGPATATATAAATTAALDLTDPRQPALLRSSLGPFPIFFPGPSVRLEPRSLARSLRVATTLWLQSASFTFHYLHLLLFTTHYQCILAASLCAAPTSSQTVIFRARDIFSASQPRSASSSIHFVPSLPQGTRGRPHVHTEALGLTHVRIAFREAHNNSLRRRHFYRNIQ